MISDELFLQVQDFIRLHWYWLDMLFGSVFLIGAVLNWNWLCDPAGAPYSHRFGRTSRRLIFGAGGAVLLVVGVLQWFV